MSPQPNPSLSPTGGELYLQVSEEFRCPCELAELAVFTSANGMTHYRHQCRECGDFTSVRAADLTPAERTLAIEFDSEVKERRRKAFGVRLAELRAEVNGDEAAEWRARYEAHLASPEWRSLRSRVLARCQGRCEGCAQRHAVEVHHLSYARLGREMLFDLVAVCNECHDAIHPDHPARATRSPALAH